MQSSIAQESAAAMSGLQIHRIERVENHVLWENYQRYRHVVSKRLAETTVSSTKLRKQSAVARASCDVLGLFATEFLCFPRPFSERCLL